MTAPRFIRLRFARDTRWWGISGRSATVLISTPFVGGALLGLTAFHSSLYRALVREDSVVEWAEVAAYLVVTVLAAAAAYRLAGNGRRLEAGLFALLALLALFALGEELSWGQRIVGLETPDRLEAINTQDELNLHNVLEVQESFNLALAAASLCAVVAPWLSRRPTLLLPPVVLGPAFLAPFLYVTSRELFFPRPGYQLAKFSEWPEVCFAGALAVFAFLSWRKAAGPQ